MLHANVQKLAAEAATTKLVAAYAPKTPEAEELMGGKVGKEIASPPTSVPAATPPKAALSGASKSLKKQPSAKTATEAAAAEDEREKRKLARHAERKEKEDAIADAKIAASAARREKEEANSQTDNDAQGSTKVSTHNPPLHPAPVHETSPFYTLCTCMTSNCNLYCAFVIAILSYM